MARKTKSIIGSFLVICMVFVLMLSGCSEQNPSVQTPNTPSTTNPSNTSDPSKTPDSKGTDDIVEIQILAPLFSDPPDMGNEYWTEYQKMTHSKLNVEWVEAGNFHTVFHLRIASGDLPEVAGVPDIRTLTLIDAIKNGAFWDLTDYLGDFSKYPNLRDNVAENCYKYLSVDGRIYATPRSRTRIDPGLAIRKDWLDKLGIPLPTTTEEFADALEKIVQSDADGNGKVDSIGFIAAEDLPSLEVAFGALTPQYNADGGQYPPVLSDGMNDYVAYCRDLYERGILDREYATVKYEEGFNLFSTNRGAAYINSIWHHWEWEQGCAQVQKDPIPEITAVALQGPKGDYGVRLNTGVSGGYYVSKKVSEEKMKRILQYFEDATSQELTKLAYYGIEGVHHEVVNGTPVLNKHGIAQVNVSSKCVGPLAYAKYGKVDSAGGSKEYNEGKRKMVEDYEKVGKADVWGNGTLISPTWSDNWPKYESEYKANKAKAVMGEISLDEYKAYIQSLRENPQLIPAFKEFADAYLDLYGHK